MQLTFSSFRKLWPHLMRYGIFSDIHSNLEALDATLEVYKKEAIDQYLCVGDIVGYGANPEECIEKIRRLDLPIVAGNHDWACIDALSIDYFNPYAKDAILWTRPKLSAQDRHFLGALNLTFINRDLTLVHGTLQNPEEFDYMIGIHAASQTFDLMQTDICFVGHSHVAGIFIKDKSGNIQYNEDRRVEIKPDNKYIVNVGSVGQPRDDDSDSCYCIFDSEKREVWIKRTSYDVETASKKIIACGLPGFLAERLRVGR